MNQGYLPVDKKIIQYYPHIIAATSIAALAVTIFCLVNGINIIYPHLYYIPIAVAALCYPKRGVVFTSLLVILFIFITFVLTNADPLALSENIMRSIVFIGIALVLSIISLSLREDGLKYQTLFDNSGAATAVINKSDRIIHSNEDFEIITGYSLKELKRKVWTELIDQDDLKIILPNTDAKEINKENQLKNIELRIIKKNGKNCHSIASVNKIPELKITLLSLIDISEKINAERILRIKEERYKKLFQQSTDAIFIHSFEGKIYDANNQACKLIGYPLDSLREISIASLHPESEQELFDKNYDILKKKGQCEFESKFFNSESSIIDVDISSVIIDTKTNVVQSIVRDITLRKKNENALLVASKKLSILSSITRHDILNQIMVALMNMEFALEDSHEKEVMDFIEKARFSVETIQKQIEFSKDYQDMGGKPPKWQNIGKLIDRCVENQNIPESVEIVKEIQGVEIYADPMLQKVFCNLIGNSIMHGGEVSEIVISVKEREEFYRIIYTDNGKGIPDEKKELIFKAGYGSNQGFGLYLVREILSITGIVITETGVPEKGAKFELIVPKNDLRITE